MPARVGHEFAHVVDSMVCLWEWLLSLVDEELLTIADKLMPTYVVTGVEKKKQFSIDPWRLPQLQGQPGH